MMQISDGNSAYNENIDINDEQEWAETSWSSRKHKHSATSTTHAGHPLNLQAPVRPRLLLPDIRIGRRQLYRLGVVLLRSSLARARIIMLYNINRPQRPHQALPTPARRRPAQQIWRVAAARRRDPAQRPPVGAHAAVRVPVCRGAADGGVGDHEGLRLVVVRQLVAVPAVRVRDVVVTFVGFVEKIDGSLLLLFVEAFPPSEKEDNEDECDDEDGATNDASNDSADVG